MHSFLNLIHLQTYNFSFKLSAIQIMKFSLDINYKIKRLQTKLLPNFISQPCVCVCDSCIHAYVHLYLLTYWCRSFFCMWYIQCTWTSPHRPLREFVRDSMHIFSRLVELICTQLNALQSSSTFFFVFIISNFAVKCKCAKIYICMYVYACRNMYIHTNIHPCTYVQIYGTWYCHLIKRLQYHSGNLFPDLPKTVKNVRAYNIH